MDKLPLITTIAAGFTAAWLLGLLAQWLRLSPIVGYLLAGVLIGPHTPGFVGDIELAHQLAEVGVILLMFGVGLHFHLGDLIAVRGVAIPGALGQSLVATLASIAVFSFFGIEPKAGAVLGMAMAVASTVVLMRVLMDADALASSAGHVAVGWLLVEDVMTVIVLVLIPVLGTPEHAAAADVETVNPAIAIVLALAKLAALVAIVIFAGARIVPWVLVKVARLRSRELFTLTVMVFSVAIAAGAYEVFGASMALGAFMAGMVVAQSPVSHQAAADALPLRDAFAVLFFVAVGMLFDPMFLVHEPLLIVAAMGVILLVKPLIALVIVAALGHSVRTALTVALGLAQIGEFSFILSDSAREYGIMPDEGHSVLVAGAILSITLNPVLFRSIDSIERWLRRYPRLWTLLNSRAERKAGAANLEISGEVAGHAGNSRLAIVVGYGPVGQTVDRLLQEAGLHTVIVDMNSDTVLELQRSGRSAIFGDASRETILEMAGIHRATHLVLTLPQSTNRAAIVALARSLNPRLKVFVRARYLREREELEQAGASAAIFEEAEAAVALSRLVLADAGAGRERIDRTVRDIRLRLILENVSNLRAQSIRNIMIPWTRVRRLRRSASLDEVRRQLGEQRFSRWPVVESDGRAPLGYLLAKDLIALGSGSDWTSLVRPLISVSPDDDIEAALVKFQQEGASICMVMQGESPLGIVTIEDILEQVIGRIEDEYPRHERMVLADVLLTDDDLLQLGGATASEAIAELAAKIPAGCLPPGVDVVELTLARERELSTHVGGGVAIPHARCPGLNQPLVVFGRSENGIDFGDASVERVKLVFLLVTPVDQPQAQVHLLSQIATVAGQEKKRQQLQQATSADEAVAVLNS